MMERSTTTPPVVAAPAESVLPTKADHGWRARLVFLGPLIFTGLMMTTDTPVINAILTRLPDAEIQLAALVVAFSLALVYEAPYIAIMEVATALSTSRQALVTLRRFYLRMGLIVGVVGALVVLTPLYDLLLRDVMNIPNDVTAAARPALAVFLLWPLPIGWRRLHQGAMIRHGHSRAVGAGASVRIVTLVGSVALLAVLFGQTLGGATIGVLAMLASVTAESFYNERAATRLLTNLPQDDPDRPALNFRSLWEYFWPLAGTAVLNTLNRPLISAGVAAAAVASADPGGADGALAAFGVGWAIVFLLNGGTLTLWPVAISWDSDPDPASRRRGMFTLLTVGATLSVLLGLLAFTPLLDWLLNTVYTVGPDVAAAARPVVRLLILVPLLFAASGLLRGKLINRGQPRAVRRAQVIDLVTMCLVLVIGVNWPDPATRPHGATLGALAALITYVVDTGVLAWTVRATPRRG